MSVYDINENALSSVYDIGSEPLVLAFDVNGNEVFSSGNWYDEISVNKYRNNEADTNYYVVDVPQIRPSGGKQYPFVYVPNGANGGTMSTYDMVQETGFYFGMNGGYFDAFQDRTLKPYGITIQNGELIREVYTYFLTNDTLTIDEDGLLGCAGKLNSGVTGAELIAEGIISSLLGYTLLVDNFLPVEVTTSTERMQRQVIGQFENGDYRIITCEGRNNDNSQGFTVTEIRDICVSMGLKFALAVDGGGSTETVVGDEQLNVVYEGTTGRIVPTYIVFNGTDNFFVPNA